MDLITNLTVAKVNKGAHMDLLDLFHGRELCHHIRNN